VVGVAADVPAERLGAGRQLAFGRPSQADLAEGGRIDDRQQPDHRLRNVRRSVLGRRDDRQTKAGGDETPDGRQALGSNASFGSNPAWPQSCSIRSRSGDGRRSMTNRHLGRLEGHQRPHRDWTTCWSRRRVSG
jgi:hypothetical protein